MIDLMLKGLRSIFLQGKFTLHPDQVQARTLDYFTIYGGFSLKNWTGLVSLVSNCKDSLSFKE